MEKYNQDKFHKIINIIRLILSNLMHMMLIVLRGQEVSKSAVLLYIKKTTIRKIKIMEIKIFKIKIT